MAENNPFAELDALYGFAPASEQAQPQSNPFAELDALYGFEPPAPAPDLEDWDFGDVMLSLGAGTYAAGESLVGVVNTIGHLVSDDYMGSDFQQGIESADEFLEEGAESLRSRQSAGYQAAQENKIYDDDTGEWSAPSIPQVIGTIAEALPQLPVYMGVAGGVKAGANAAIKALGKNSERVAKLSKAEQLTRKNKIDKALTIGSLGVAGSVLGGSDTFNEAYEAVISKLTESDFTHEERHRIAEGLARTAGATQMPIAALTNMVGLGLAATSAGKTVLHSMAKGAVTDAIPEAIEEISQGYQVNLGIHEADTNFDTSTGLIHRGALGAMAGAGMGGGMAGLTHGAQKEAEAREKLLRQQELADTMDAFLNRSFDEVMNPELLPAPDTGNGELLGYDATFAPKVMADDEQHAYQRPPQNQKMWDEAEEIDRHVQDTEQKITAANDGRSDWQQPEVIETILAQDIETLTGEGRMIRTWAEQSRVSRELKEAAQQADADWQARPKSDDVKNPRQHGNVSFEGVDDIEAGAEEVKKLGYDRQFAPKTVDGQPISRRPEMVQAAWDAAEKLHNIATESAQAINQRLGSEEWQLPHIINAVADTKEDQRTDIGRMIYTWSGQTLHAAKAIKRAANLDSVWYGRQRYDEAERQANNTMIRDGDDIKHPRQHGEAHIPPLEGEVIRPSETQLGPVITQPKLLENNSAPRLEQGVIEMGTDRVRGDSAETGASQPSADGQKTPAINQAITDAQQQQGLGISGLPELPAPAQNVNSGEKFPQHSDQSVANLPHSEVIKRRYQLREQALNEARDKDMELTDARDAKVQNVGDPRWRREDYRGVVAWVASQLNTAGGNPGWFVDAPARIKRLGVAGWQLATEKALSGTPLNKAERQVVHHLLDQQSFALAGQNGASRGQGEPTTPIAGSLEEIGDLQPNSDNQSPPKPKPAPEPELEPELEPEPNPAPEPEPETKPALEPKPDNDSKLDNAADNIDAEIEAATKELADLFKASLNKINSGIDPAILAAGTKLGALYVAKGVVKFAQFSRAIISQMKAMGVDAKQVTPVLKELYRATQMKVSDELFDKMDSTRFVRKFDLATLEIEQSHTNGKQALSDYLFDRMGDITDNRQLKAVLADFHEVSAKDISDAQMKAAQEALEVALVKQARNTMHSGLEEKALYNKLVDQYKTQPLLNMRSSTSMQNQAYSTPAPIAMIASQFAGIETLSSVYEPTAGNGMLLIGADIQSSTVNEINDERAANLTKLGYQPTQNDATGWVPATGKFDAVIMNPPFGRLRNEDGLAPVRVDGYTIKSLDHLIASKALESMKDDGRAAIIIGADKQAGVIGSSDRVFFNWLYSHYNVVDHFEIDGKLYHRQGAAWPIRAIIIHGRKESDEIGPQSGTIERLSTWDEIYDYYNESVGTLGQRDDAGGAKGSEPTGGSSSENNISQPPAGSDGGQTGGTNGGRGGHGGRSSSRGNGSRSSQRDESGPKPQGGGGDVDGGKPPVIPSESGKPDGAEQTSKQGGKTGLSGANTGKPTGKPSKQPVKGGASSFQVPYPVRSKGFNDAVLVPRNMADSMEKALAKLERDIGMGVDEYVMQKLNYPSEEALFKSFMGLQVDAVASAIYNIEVKNKGVVIADQTGVGKGRQAAAIIRYAKSVGKTPIFFTVSNNLYTDMFDDLHNIDEQSAPFLIDSGAYIHSENNGRVEKLSAGDRLEKINHIIDTGTLPKDNDALFLTYHQIKKNNVQRQVVAALANNAIFILDESHNVSGDRVARVKVNDKWVNRLTAAGFVFNQIANAPVVYLSATFAKRADNMPVYYRTDIMDAVDKPSDLVDALAAGGVPMQEVISNQLTLSNQLFRRERSFEGISIPTVIDYENSKAHRAMSDEITSGLIKVMDADVAFENIFYPIYLAEQNGLGGGASVAGNKAKKNIDHSNFNSVVHNYIRQMLLAIKTEKAADMAIEVYRRGEKPVIALENTMGSFLTSYTEANNLQIGDRVDASYKDVLLNALMRSRRITKKLKTGQKETIQIEMDMLDPATYAAYQEAEQVINGLDFGGLAISPIDYMRQRLIDEGISVSEITGRDLMIDYSGEYPVLAMRDKKERKDKRRTVDMFNRGDLDALIANVSGSTGLSIHASEGFKDQKPRTMIVAQAMQDINILMQMLGRINRTGQVELPNYFMLGLDLPAEKRPMGITAHKLSLLNALTSANDKSDTSISAPDMMNLYGDRIANEYLSEDREVANLLDLTSDISLKGAPKADLMKQFTGRMALLKSHKQDSIYEELESTYGDLIDYLNRAGQNLLVSQTLDLDAKILDSTIVYEGKAPGTIFGGHLTMHRVNVKYLGKPPLPEDVQSALDKALKLPSSQEILDGKASDTAYRVNKSARIAELQAEIASLEAKDSKSPGIGALKLLLITAEESLQHYDSTKTVHADGVTRFAVGNHVRLNVADEIVTGVVTAVKDNHTHGRGNPYALSKFHVTFMVNSGVRQAKLPLSKLMDADGDIFIKMLPSSGNEKLDIIFQPAPPNRREQRYIATGNLTMGMSKLKNGHIVNFTDEAQNTQQGIIMPRNYGEKGELTGDSFGDIRITEAAIIRQMFENNKEEMSRAGGVFTVNQAVRLTFNNDKYMLFALKSKKDAIANDVKFDPAIISLVGDLVGSAQYLSAVIPESKLTRVLARLLEIGPLYALHSMRKTMLDAGGKPPPEAENSFTADDPLAKLGDNKTHGASVEKVKSWIKDIAAQLGGKIEVVASYADLPAKVKSKFDSRIKGAFYKGKMYIVADKMLNQEMAQETTLHEMLGHGGVMSFLGDKLDATVERIYKSMGKGARERLAKRYRLDLNTAAGRRELVLEYIAHTAEKGQRPSLVRKFISALKAMLRKLFPSIKWSEGDILSLIENSRLDMRAKSNASKAFKKTSNDTPPHDVSRRKFLKDLAALAVTMAANPAAAGGDLKLGKAKPLNKGDANQKLSGKTSKAINGKTVAAAMRLIREDAPDSLKPLIDTIINLADSSDAYFSMQTHRNMNAYGATDVDAQGRVRIRIFGDGDDYGTVLHEALHSLVMSRYAKITMALRGNYRVVEQELPGAMDALNQLNSLRHEFYQAIKKDFGGKDGIPKELRPAASSGDEFFVRALTDPITQTYMASKRYEGKTLLQRFKDWVSTSLFGSESGTAPSWLDAAIGAADDLLTAMKGDEPNNAYVNKLNEFQKSSRRATPKDDDIFASLDDSAERDADLEAAEREGFTVYEPDWKEDFLRVIQDKFVRMKVVQKAIRDKFGADAIDDDIDVYRGEEMNHGRAEKDLKHFDRRFVDPLVKAMKAAKVTQEELDKFLYAKYAPARNQEIAGKRDDMAGGGSGMSDKEAAAILAAISPDKRRTLERLAKRVYAMGKFQRQLFVLSGLKTQEEVDGWNSHEFYVPLKGNANKTSFVGRVTGGFSVKNKTRAAMGRASYAESPLVHMIAQAEETILDAEKNRVAMRLLKLVKKFPNAGYWKVLNSVHEDRKPRINPKTGRVEHVANMNLRNDPDVVVVRENGKERYIKINDPLLVRAMNNLGPEPLNLFERTLSKINSYLAMINVALNPEFIYSNFFRDLQTAMLNLDAESRLKDGKIKGESLMKKVLSNVGNAYLAIYGSERSHTTDSENKADPLWSKHYEEYQNTGAKVGFFGLEGFDTKSRNLQDKLAEADGNAYARSKEGLRDLKEWVLDLNGAIENAVRLSAYVAAREAGLSREQAGSLAKNLTVNFNRKGEWGSLISSLYLFANASIQGTANLARTLKGKQGLKKMAALVGASAALTAMNYAISDDDEDGRSFYDKIPDYVKERNLIFMIPGSATGEYLKFPMPYGYNTFNVAGVLATEVAMGNRSTGSMASMLTGTFLGSFNPMGSDQSETSYFNTMAKLVSPTFIDPIIQIAINENFHGGPVHKDQSPYGAEKPSSHTYFRSTGEVSKTIVQALNSWTGGSEFRPGLIDINPDDIEHLAGFLTGAIGGLALRTRKTLNSIGDGELPEVRDVPFVRKMYGKINPRGDTNLYYNRREILHQFEAEWKQVRKGGAEYRKQWRADHKAEYLLFDDIKRADRRLRSLRKLRKRIELSTMEAAKKKTAIERMNERIDKVVIRFNTAWEKAGLL